MLEPETLTVGELAARWKQTPRQIVEQALTLRLPIYFAFDGLVFDAVPDRKSSSEHWKETQEIKSLTRKLASSESRIKRSARGETSEWEHPLSTDERKALRVQIETDECKLAALTESDEQRAIEHNRHKFRGYLRAAPSTLWEIASAGAAQFPRNAYHTQSPIHVVTLPGEKGQFWEGRIVNLEPGPGCEHFKKNILTTDDLCAFMLEVKAIEAHQQAPTGSREVHAPASAAAQEEPNKEVMWSYFDAIDAVRKLVAQDPLALYLSEWLTQETKEQKKLSPNLTLGGLDLPVGTDLYVRLQAVQGAAEKLARLVDGKKSPRLSYQIPIHDRLEPKTDWRGGYMAHTDVLTLDDAAKFATKHSREEVTPSDILRAAGRGQIHLKAIIHRTAKVQRYDGGIYCNKGQENENMAPAGAIASLPKSACEHLAATGRASWRTFDGFELIDGVWCRYTKGLLVDGEPDFETSMADCRVTGREVHALADEFCDLKESPRSDGTQKDSATNPSEQKAALERPSATALAKLQKPSLTTSQIADIFDSVDSDLKRKLGDVSHHRYFLTALVTRGKAPRPSTWCPLEIAKALASRGDNLAVLNRVFLKDPRLKPWLFSWQESQEERNAFGL